MEYRDKRKRLLLFCIICCIILVFGVSWGIFKYSKYSSNASLVLGDIYMSSKENNILLNKLEPMSPNEGIERGSKYNFSVEGYNTSNKDIYYGVYLNYGNEESGKTRFKDEDMMMYLTETKNGLTKAVYGPGSVKDFNDKMIYASTINSETKKDEKIEIDYELTVWLSDNILISDTEESFEGKNIYTTNEYQNGYASINVKVYGDFEEKNIKKANENIVGTLISSNENYEIKDDIKNAKEINEDVKIVITTDKEAKLYLTNLDTNVKKVENLTLKNNLYLFEKIETDRSRYSYYFEYLDGTVSQIYYYNVNIKKYENINKPTNVLCSNNVYNGSLQLITSIEENNSYTLINNKQKDVGSYQITAKLKSGFKWIDETLDDVSFNCSIEKKDLIITPNAISKEYGTSDPELTYAYSGNVEGEIPKFSGSLQRASGEKLGSYLIDKGTLDIIDNNNFKKNNYNLVFSSKEVKFTIKEKTASKLTANLEYTETIYDGLEHKPKVIIKDGTNTLIEGTDYDVSYKNNKNTGEATVVIVYKGNYSGTIEKKFTIKAKEVIVPTANNYCNTLTYNGTSQTLTKTAGEGYTFSNNTGIDAKEYTITVALKENYVWNDGTNTNKTFKCSIAKKSIAITWDNPALTYNGKDQSPTPTANSGISTETINLGKTTGKNAGNYTATATCLSVVGGSATCNNYTFTNTTKAFTINKTAPSLTISSSSLTTVYGTNTSFTYTYSGDGTTFTCNSSNTSVATCSVDKTNKKVIITPVKVGSANITLSVNAGVNYNTISKSINVIVNGITRVVTYTKGVGVASISKTSDSCTTTGNATSCVVNLPTITSSNGYSVDGWYLNSSKIGTSGSSYTLSGNVQLNAQATVNTYLVLFDTNIQIYNQNSANWIKHGSTAIDNSNTYSNTTGVKVYSNENKWTGLKIPIINAKKNTNYLLSVRAKKISDFSGNLRVYAPTYDSSNTTMSYNHGISITSSNITTTDWTYFLYSFNSGSYATMPWILIDYDTESTGPVYISDIHLTEFRGLNLKYGTKLGTLFSPTISGHTLNGWYTAKTGGTKITADTTVPANDITYYAHYEAKTYTINYNSNGGSGTMASSTATFGYEAKISANTFTKNGYTFAGWTTKSDGSDDGYGWTNWSKTWTYDNGEHGISNNTLNLYARWTPKKIKLTLNANGGSGGTTAIWYYYGTSIFYSNEACTNKITAITKPTKKGYSLEHFYGDGTSGGDNGERYVAYDTTAFAGDLATDIYKDATLYAKWTPKTYTINYNSNNGSGSMTASSVIFNTSVSIKSNAFTRSGYSFVGWSTKTDNSDDGYGWTNWSGTWSYDNGEYGISNNALNLYARWAPYYCATFNANGAASISKSSACCTATNGSSCTVTAPTITPKTNFEVLGWTANTANLTVPTIAAYNDNGSLATITLTGNKTFYAVTKSSDDANKKYNVEFNLNGSDSYSINGVSYKETATFECHNPSVYNGAAIPNACSYTLPTITRNGGTVYGWDRNDANQGTPAYKASQTISLTDDISLSAITSRPITLSYNANGGTTTLTSQTAQVFNDDEGAWFNIPAYDNANMCRGKTNQYVGYKYVGLGTSSGASVTSNCQGSRAYLTQNTTLYALWKTYYATASHSVSSGLIIRKGEGTSYAKVTTIPRGVKVYVTGPAGSCKSSHKWFPVIYGNYSGYSSAGANCGTKNFSNFTYVANNSCSTSYACSATNNNMTASPSKIVLNIKTGVLSSKITVDAQCGSYSFSSSDTSVVTVSSDGTVSTTSSAVAEGAQKKATINITSAGGCTASVDVIVKNIIETAPTVNISFSGTTYSSGYKSPVTATVTCSSQEGIASFIPKDSKGETFTITGDNYNKTATITLSGGSSGRTVSATCKSNNDLSASNSKTTKIYVYSASSACGVKSYGYSGTCSCNTSVLYSKTCNSDIYNMGGCKAYCSNVYFTTGSGTCTRSANYKSCYHT